MASRIQVACGVENARVIGQEVEAHFVGGSKTKGCGGVLLSGIIKTVSVQPITSLDSDIFQSSNKSHGFEIRNSKKKSGGKILTTWDCW